MDSSILRVIILIVLLMFSAFFSSTETAFSSMNRIRVKNLASDGNKKAARALLIVEDFDRFISTILIGNNIVNIALTALATTLFIDVCKGDVTKGTAIATVVTTVAVLIFGEITPKSLAKESPERYSMAVSSFVSFALSAEFCIRYVEKACKPFRKTL